MTPFLLALVVALGCTPLLRRLARAAGFLDTPGPRSSHVVVTPRGGGLAILLGAGVAAGASGFRGAGAPQISFLVGATMLLAMGLWDDRRELPAPLKLAVQALAAGALALASGGLGRAPLPPPLDVPLGPLGVPAAMLWVLVVLNAYNFMDGIDGLAALQGSITGVGLGIALGGDALSALALGAAGGCAGFLPWNWSRASVFMGDVGSNVLGYTFAALPLLLPHGRRDECALFVMLSLWLFLADAVWTRLRRLARGGRWYAAHREHVYQRLVASGLGHAKVTLAIGAGSALLTLGALVLPGGWGALALATALFLGEIVWARRREAAAA